MLARDPDAKLLAGGQTLLPVLKHGLASPTMLVDLRDIDGLSVISGDKDAIHLGAMTSHAAVARLEPTDSTSSALAMLASGIADPLVRNLGTIGGSIANNDPAADYPAALLGLGATVVTDRREIAADDFFTGIFETALAADEIVTRIRFPRARRAGYYKFANPASGYVMVGAFVADFGDHVRVAINGARSCVYRDTAFETFLASRMTTDGLNDVASDASDFNDDLHASAEYRAHLVPRVVGRAVSRLLGMHIATNH
jgi:aerobic carbon-monoxide dehydrogenase medium subunit